MSTKAEETADLLMYEFQIGDRVFDYEGDFATVIRHEVWANGEVRYIIRYDEPRYPNVGWSSMSLKKLP